MVRVVLNESLISIPHVLFFFLGFISADIADQEAHDMKLITTYTPAKTGIK